MKRTISACTALTAALGLVSSVAGVSWAQQEEAQPVLPGSPVFEQSGASPDIDFSGVQATLGGEPTRVLVLGTSHLANLPEDRFDPAHLSLLLDRLEGFAPDIIAVESIGGRGCDELRRYAELYPGTAERYCIEPDMALESLGLTQPEAAAEVERVRTDWPDAPAAAERRRYAALLFGAGEPWSAALQWAHLEADERMAGDGISDDLAERLDAMQLSRNENNLIAVALAERLGLETLATMDDHTADLVQTRAPETLGPAIGNVWSVEHPREAEFEARRDSLLGSPELVLERYRFANSEELAHFTLEKDFGAAAASGESGAVARQYVAWWQVRGLRMAANVIEAAGNDPGARVLVIVGSSHKPYFDAYLDQMHDIELVDVEAVLAE